MESQKSLNDIIILRIIKIQEEFPELTKYLDEMPERFLSITGKGINNKELKDYLESLNDLLETYAKEHEQQYAKINRYETKKQ
ncbi:hypothetical protein [Snuella lapsa]|uniref:Uncharacterized protein n=1 Tax=Snuella lapsa TaxID=870481 RepID=A0ABP6X5I0_9FLAO